jgi:hypothetical protein
MKTFKISKLIIIAIALINFISCEKEEVTLPAETPIAVPKIRTMTVQVDSGARTNPITYDFNYVGDRLVSIQSFGNPYAEINYYIIDNRLTIIRNNHSYAEIRDTFDVTYLRAGTSNYYYIDSILQRGRSYYADFGRNSTQGNTLNSGSIFYENGTVNDFQIHNVFFLIGNSSNVTRYTSRKADILRSGNFSSFVNYTFIANQPNLPYQFITNNMIFDNSNYGTQGLDILFILQQCNIFPYRPHENLIEKLEVPVFEGSVASPIYANMPVNLSYTRDTATNVTSMQARIYGDRVAYQFTY